MQKRIIPPEPEIPINSLRIDGDIFSESCPECNSSLARKWIFFKIGGCIQPKCKN